MSKSKALTGIAGAHFVVAELSQRGYIATVTSRNTEGIDVLASNIDGSKIVSVQVKTSGAKNRKNFIRSWILNKKQESIFSDNLFYVFVDLNEEDKKPDFYIVPSKIVADYIKTETEKWMKSPSKTGKPHVDSGIRLFEIYEDEIAKKYYNNWELLGLDENEHN